MSLILQHPNGSLITLHQNFSSDPGPLDYGQVVFVPSGGDASLPDTNTLDRQVIVSSPLATLLKSDPNVGDKTWKLIGAGTGSFQGGWVLTLALAPTIANIPSVFITEKTSTNLLIGVNDLDGTVTNIAASVPGGIATFATNVAGTVATVTLTAGPTTQARTPLLLSPRTTAASEPRTRSHWASRS
jgi:hypothetical protein